MNLLPASIEGHRAYVGNSEVTLGAAYPTLPELARLQIGARPDFVTPTPGNGPKVQVRRVEFGRKRLAHVSLDGLPLVATVPDSMPGIGMASKRTPPSTPPTCSSIKTTFASRA